MTADLSAKARTMSCLKIVKPTVKSAFTVKRNGGKVMKNKSVVSEILKK